MANKYQTLYQAVLHANPSSIKTKQILQEEANLLWRDIKNGCKNYDDEVKNLKDRARKSKANLLGFWAKLPTPTNIVELPKVNDNSCPREPSVTVVENKENQSTPIRASAHAQQKAISELAEVEKNIADLYVVKRTIGLSNDNKKNLDSLCKSKKGLENKLKRLRDNAKIKSNKRAQTKKKLKNIVKLHPELAQTIKSQGKLKFTNFGISVHIHIFLKGCKCIVIIA